MQVASRARQLTRVCRPPIRSNSELVQSPLEGTTYTPQGLLLWLRYHSTNCSDKIWFSAVKYAWFIHGNCIPSFTPKHQRTIWQSQLCSTPIPKASFCSAANLAEGGVTEAVKEVYDKMLNSVVNKRTAPPNAWMWSLLEHCSNHEDIKHLFDILQKLRIFRLSNLRIHADFNPNLCREITKACVRVGAIEFGKKALWKHTVYGLTPSIASAHSLLMYAKEKNDATILVDIMELMKKNDLPLQPGTADIVFSICYDMDRWDLISKYSKMFVKAGVKLRQPSFDVLMQFAAKIGDVDTLWKIEKLRSETMKRHTLASGFSCVKGFLLEHKPEDAAGAIQVLSQTLSDEKKPGLVVELQKLVSEWPLEVINHSKTEDKKALSAALQNDIPAMLSGLTDMGLDVNASMEDLTKLESVL